MNLGNNAQIITTKYSLDMTTKKVVAQFSASLYNLMMSAPEATRMAQILLACARELDPAAVAGYTWPGMEKPTELTPITPAPEGGKPQ